MFPSSRRPVRLIDARDANRPIIEATLFRDASGVMLTEVEESWTLAREDAAALLIGGQLALEHTHWNWGNKIDSVLLGHHKIVAIEYEGAIQGLMAVLTTPRPARLDDQQIVYVDYLETAPWNLKGTATAPRFIGVGTMLIADAVRLSHERGLFGAVGLHSLPQAEMFYARIGMTRVRNDPDYYDLPYFEFDAQQAMNWLAAIGESV